MHDPGPAAPGHPPPGRNDRITNARIARRRAAGWALAIVAAATAPDLEAASIYHATAPTQASSNQPTNLVLNAQGQVLGLDFRSPQGITTFLYDPAAGGKATTLTTDERVKPPAGEYFPQSMNDDGQSFGYRDGRGGVASGGTYAPVPGFPRAINNEGDVAGWGTVGEGRAIVASTGFGGPPSATLVTHSYILGRGGVEDLGTVPGLAVTEVGALNDRGRRSPPAAAPTIPCRTPCSTTARP